MAVSHFDKRAAAEKAAVRADPELYHSMKAAQRFRHTCSYCMKHKRTCPVCAGVL